MSTLPIRYRDGTDYRVIGVVTAVGQDDVYATVRVDAQRGRRKDGVEADIPAHVVDAKVCTRMLENGATLAVGDSVVLLVPLEPTRRLVTIITIIHRGAR